MRGERGAVAILGGVIGGVVVGLLAYIYVSYKLAHFPDSTMGRKGLPVTIPASALTSVVSQFAAAGGV